MFGCDHAGAAATELVHEFSDSDGQGFSQEMCDAWTAWHPSLQWQSTGWEESRREALITISQSAAFERTIPWSLVGGWIGRTIFVQRTMGSAMMVIIEVRR
jgi:hypothetical protein